MLRRTFFLLFLFAGFISSCSTSLKNYTANKKYSKTELQSDFLFLKKVLEKKHPSLYWYTSKDSIDTKFSQQYELIKDSMTEEFMKDIDIVQIFADAITITIDPNSGKPECTVFEAQCCSNATYFFD